MHYDLSAYSWNETEVANYLQYLATYFRPKSILGAEDILGYYKSRTQFSKLNFQMRYCFRK